LVALQRDVTFAARGLPAQVDDFPRCRSMRMVDGPPLRRSVTTHRRPAKMLEA
jgi:hypothetical protein